MSLVFAGVSDGSSRLSHTKMFHSEGFILGGEGVPGKLKISSGATKIRAQAPSKEVVSNLQWEDKN